MFKKILILIIFYSLFLIIPVFAQQKYESSWSENCLQGRDVIDIKRNLVNKGCGKFYCKRNLNHDGEYLIKCIGSGNIIRYYILWPRINQIMGPYYKAGEFE